jgi:hypothetical protein
LKKKGAAEKRRERKFAEIKLSDISDLPGPKYKKGRIWPQAVSKKAKFSNTKMCQLNLGKCYMFYRNSVKIGLKRSGRGQKWTVSKKAKWQPWDLSSKRATLFLCPTPSLRVRKQVTTLWNNTSSNIR